MHAMFPGIFSFSQNKFTHFFFIKVSYNNHNSTVVLICLPNYIGQDDKTCIFVYPADKIQPYVAKHYNVNGYLSLISISVIR